MLKFDCGKYQFNTHLAPLDDWQMERSFDLPQYVETTSQFPSALECADLSIPASTLEMLF
jgi:hypothetical protein